MGCYFMYTVLLFDYGKIFLGKVTSKSMWDTFYSHSAYIQITFLSCQG